MTEEQQRDMHVRQGELTALSQHPSWPVYEAEADRREERLRKTMVARMMGEEGLSLEDQAYWRGFIHGMRWFVNVPTKAEASLEEYLRSLPREEEDVSGRS